MRSAKRSLLLAVALLSLLGCRSVAWQQGGDESWRGATLRRGELARVAAVQESDAAEAYLEFEDLCAALRATGVTPPSPPLLRVVAADEELWFKTPEETLRHFAVWHAELVHGEASASSKFLDEVPTEMLLPMAHAAAGALQLDAEELALPPAWCSGIRWGLIVPTVGNRVAAADAALDWALAHEEIPFAARLMLMPMMPWVRSEARSAFDAQVRRLFLEATLAAARREGPVPADALKKCLRELGIDDEDLGNGAPGVDALRQVRGKTDG